VADHVGALRTACRVLLDAIGSNEEEPALISERHLALQARIRLANAAYHPLTLMRKEDLTYWSNANFSD